MSPSFSILGRSESTEALKELRRLNREKVQEHRAEIEQERKDLIKWAKKASIDSVIAILDQARELEPDLATDG